MKRYPENRVKSAPILYGEHLDKPGHLYRYEFSGQSLDLIVPASGDTMAEQEFLGLIVGVVITVLVAAAIVSYWIAGQVARPLEQIVTDIGHIAAGNLRHRTRVSAGGEIALLARSVDRMAKSLQDAQQTELELSIRQREMEVAAQVREALLPQSTPILPGYDLAAEYVAAQELSGDFHEFILHESGQVGLLVCDVAGQGLPGALVGATARAYLRRELSHAPLSEALKTVNRQVVEDVRRGMFVTALAVLIDPKENVATIACAGHKLPLIRYCAADGKIRLVQPEGIGLGFDRGPIFDTRLQVQELSIEPGDRFVLANTAAVSIQNESGEELGEKRFYAHVLRLAAADGATFLSKLFDALNKYAGERGLGRNISVVTVSRT
jgi:sigma-B regulation protein RsbU (phosphoserine phosphatase)